MSLAVESRGTKGEVGSLRVIPAELGPASTPAARMPCEPTGPRIWSGVDWPNENRSPSNWNWNSGYAIFVENFMKTKAVQKSIVRAWSMTDSASERANWNSKPVQFSIRSLMNQKPQPETSATLLGRTGHLPWEPSAVFRQCQGSVFRTYLSKWSSDRRRILCWNGTEDQYFWGTLRKTSLETTYKDLTDLAESHWGMISKWRWKDTFRIWTEF